MLICTLSALSSFGPVVALANLGASDQVFASADRVLDLLDEDPVTADVTDGADTVFTGAQAEHVSFAYAREEVLHDLSDYPGKEDRGHHGPLRQRQIHLSAAAHALLGCEQRHHPVW